MRWLRLVYLELRFTEAAVGSLIGGSGSIADGHTGFVVDHLKAWAD